jgi:hypothetical protein
MFKKNYTLIIILSIIIIAYSSYNYIENTKDLKDKINVLLIKYNLEKYKSKILFIREKNKQIENLKKKLADLEYSETRIDLEESYYNLYEFHSKIIENSLAKKTKSFNYNINNTSFIIDYYSINNFFNGKHITATATTYLEKISDNIILTTGDGHFFYFNINEFNNDLFKLNKIKTNILDLITDINFITKSKIGIKDVLVDNKNIIITIPLKKKEDCYSFAIYKSQFNYDFLKFKKIFETKECQKTKGSNHFGGRIEVLDKDHYIFTVGDFGYSANSQKKNENLFGKIVKLNKNSNKIEIISLGHRNPQGLYFDIKKNIILSTEHGPVGGDEINLINLNKIEEKNFGWPYVSYGIDANSAWKNNHSKNGYIEPIKYYTPSIAISEIVKIPRNFFNSDHHYFVASMGGISDGGYQSIHLINLNKNFKIIGNKNLIKINDRVRDLLTVKELNIVLASTEISPGIIKISKVNN